MHLEDYISKERLDIYTDVLKLAPEEAMGGYNWNKALSAAMQPLLHCLEVTLRNAIDYAIRHNPPPGAAGLWRTDAYWIYDLPRYIGDKNYIRQGKRFKTDKQGNPRTFPDGRPVYHFTAWEEDCVRRVSKRIKDAGKDLTPERVISGLDFGFWTNLLTAEYEEPRNLSLLWPHLTADVFPSRPANIRRHQLETKFARIRDLRNRLAHHEAVWKFQELDANGKPDYSRPIYGLNASLHLLRRAWDDILEALYWISPARHAAFITEGHHARFETLATREGLQCYTGRDNVTLSLNVRPSREARRLIRSLQQGKTTRVTDRSRLLAVIGPDWSWLKR
ncbi:Abi family protein [Enterobacter hormaechei]|uniref:Abi family protein n=1 Tax=Enterobacter hormaechei TaxID=158836 RepID=UPI0016398B23|nr:Abi family protein [Enterobacter hormaechei]MBK1548174.1 Abi family protein [Enterobacter hormaechei]